ncbi:MAG: aldo/keto reductase [Acidimicrobiales bacterium]
MALAPLTWLIGGGVRTGLGCMRLPTGSDGDEARAVVAAALASGVTVLDTARAYDGNERLVAGALRAAGAAPGQVRVVTKGGMARPPSPSPPSGAQGQRAWVPDGRARAIRADCEASLTALDGWPIALWLLHAPDPRTPWATSLRAVGRLADEGLVEAVGLSNVTRAQLDQALDTVPVAAVQVAVSVLDDGAARGGVLARCEERDLAVLAHSPLGGPSRVARLRRDPVLAEVAAAHSATPAQVALAWLLTRSPVLVPIPGARRPEAAGDGAAAAALTLDPAEIEAITRHVGWPPGGAGGDGRPRSSGPRTSAPAPGEVVLLMGIPGAGKTRASADLVADGHHRLNRDERGGTLRQLAADLDAALASGRRRVVVDNTYLTRAARSRVVEVARSHGLGVRCRWLDTPLAQAQVNLVHRLLDHFGGTLPSPEELAVAARQEPGLLTPTAQMRAARQLEEPTADEGFAALERIPFQRRAPAAGGRPGLLVAAAALRRPGWEAAISAAVADIDDQAPAVLLFDWRPGNPPSDRSLADEAAAELGALMGGPVQVAQCPHPGGPPICWCRPPLPGLVLTFARAHSVDLARSQLVGTSPAHRSLAAAVGATVVTS